MAWRVALILAAGWMVPFGSASAASTGVVLTPSLTRIGDQVALDVFYERGANRFTTGPSVVLTPSLLPQPTIWGWQLGWQYHFVTESRFRPYVHPEYQVVFFRPGTMHTLRWQYGLEWAFAERWMIGQSLGFGLVREHLGDYRAWTVDGFLRLSAGVRF